MEQSPKTSFIPKQSTGAAVKRQHRTFNILTFFAMIIFLASLTLSVGVYFYRQYSERALEQSKKALADKRSEFDEREVQSLRALEQRLLVAEGLLNKHLSISKVFDALERRVQDQAQITSLSFLRKESGNASVKLMGEALTFNTVALQEKQFTDEHVFAPGTLIFSDLNVVPGQDGAKDAVVFTVSSSLDEKFISYTASPELPDIPLTVEASTATSSSDNLLIEDGMQTQ